MRGLRALANLETSYRLFPQVLPSAQPTPLGNPYDSCGTVCCLSHPAALGGAYLSVFSLSAFYLAHVLLLYLIFSEFRILK